MKLIIDIPDYNLNDVKNGSIACGQILKAVKNAIPYEERPQGEWLFTEIDENYHVYGQCSICKERNRIGKACRSCGARMKGGAE